MRLGASTLPLLLANVALVALIGLSLARPTAPGWLPADASPSAQPTVTAVPPPELAQERRAMTWTRPIFSADRQPDPEQQQEEVEVRNPLADLMLTAIFRDGDAQWIYLQAPGEPAFKIAKGEALDNGWMLEQLSQDAAIFSRQGQTQTLRLPMLRLPPPSQAPTLSLPRTTTP